MTRCQHCQGQCFAEQDRFEPTQFWCLQCGRLAGQTVRVATAADRAIKKSSSYGQGMRRTARPISDAWREFAD